MTGRDKDFDPVDLASEESFPASDPPAWIPAAAGAVDADTLVTAAILVRLVAKPGFEAEVQDFLIRALPVVQQEVATSAWFALKFAPRTFAVVAAFPDEDARDSHLHGHVGQRLMELDRTQFAMAPAMEPLQIIAAKLPR